MMKTFLISILFLLPLVSAEDVINWTVGENQINFTFDYIPKQITFDYDKSLTYISLAQIEDYIYTATFEVSNETPRGKYTIVAKTNKQNHLAEINFPSEILAIEQPIPAPRTEPISFWGFDQVELIILGSGAIILFLAFIFVLIQWEIARKKRRKQ